MTSKQQIILIGGGTRCGKSNLALTLARRLGPRRLFIATAQARDDAEMVSRIDRHRATRGDDFATLEEPLAIVDAVASARDADVFVLDCVTIWLANMLLRGDDPDQALAHVDALANVLEKRRMSAVIVSNEVGLGIVPETPLGRVFRDLSGLAHQRLAAVSDEVYFGVMGMMLRLKPSPVVGVEGGIPT